jgi:protein SCO1/2
MSAPRNRLILTFAAGIAAVALAGCGPQGLGAPAASGVAQIGGPFQLVDQNGKAVDQHVLDGKWSAVFFGYTYCPDVCPTTLQTLAQAKADLGAAAKNLQVVFVTVDPQRDTPAQMKAYLATPAFPQPTIGLTGSPAAVAAAAKAYRVYYQKQGSGEGYLVNHSSIIYLMDPKGNFDEVVREDLKPAEIATQIGAAMKAGAKGAA